MNSDREIGEAFDQLAIAWKGQRDRAEAAEKRVKDLERLLDIIREDANNE